MSVDLRSEDVSSRSSSLIEFVSLDVTLRDELRVRVVERDERGGGVGTYL